MEVELSEKETSQTSTHTLFVVKNVEFVNKLINVVTTFGNDAEIRHKSEIVALLKQQSTRGEMIECEEKIDRRKMSTYVIKVCSEFGSVKNR